MLANGCYVCNYLSRLFCNARPVRGTFWRCNIMKSKPTLTLISMVLGAAVAIMPSTYAQESAMLEEIVVTAQKREQSLHDVAGAITAIQGEHVDDYNILNFEDLERISAGFQLSQPNPRNVTIAFRGITFDPESGTAAAADVYLNDVVQRGDNIFGALYDIERVEVLRGAQGSVQGSTSPAGAIILHTKKPDLSKFGGQLQGTYTDTNSGLNLQAALNVPIVPEVFGLRIAVYDDKNDGNNVKNITTGKVQDRESTSFRISLRLQPTENLDITLVHQNNDETVLGTPPIEGTRTSAAGISGVSGIPCVALAAVPTLNCVTLTQSDNTALAANDVSTGRDSDLTTFNLDWTFGGHQLSYILGRTESKKPTFTENDVSNNLPLQNFFYQTGLSVRTDTDYLTHQTSNTEVEADIHELRIASTDHSVWNYMVGLYYRNQETSTRFDSWNTAARYLPLTALNDPRSPVQFTGGYVEGINSSVGGVIPFNSKTKALFTAHNFQFGNRAALEIALRYQEIERFNQTPIRFAAFNQRERISIVNAAAANSGVALPGAVATATAESFLAGTLGAIMTQSNIDGIPLAHQRPETDSLTGAVRFKYDLSDSLNLYASWNRGFREGGISVTPGANLPASDLLYDDENSSAYELGAKILFGGIGEVNVTVFHQVFDGYLGYVTDLQYLSNTGRTSGTAVDLPGGIVYNADAIFQGIDLDWRLILSSNFRLGGSLNYTKAEFDNASVPCNTRTGQQRLGRCTSNARVPGSPEYSANVFADFTLPLGSALNFFVRGNAKYNDGIVATRATEVGMSPGNTDSFVLVDLFLGLNHDKWEVSLWSKNLLDDDAKLDLTNPGDNFDINGDFSVLRVQQERTLGATVRFNF